MTAGTDNIRKCCFGQGKLLFTCPLIRSVASYMHWNMHVHALFDNSWPIMHWCEYGGVARSFLYIQLLIPAG